MTATNLDYVVGTGTNAGTLTGTVGLTFGGAELFPGSSSFSTTVKGFAGSYNLGTQATSFSATEIDVALGQVLKAQALNAAIGWDGSSVNVSLSSLTATSPEFPGLSGSISNFTASDAGFSLGNATLSDSKITLGSFLELDNVILSAQNLVYTTNPSSLTGTVTLTLGGAKLFPTSTAFNTTVTNFTGSYNLGTQATTITAGSIGVTVGSSANASNPVLSVLANNVAFALTPNGAGTDDSVVITVGSATATLDEFSNSTTKQYVTGNVTNLTITNDGFSVGSATLSYVGSISAFGGKFVIVNPSATLTNFGYSVSGKAFTAAGLTLSASEVDFNQGGKASVTATGLTSTISFAPGDVGHAKIQAGTVTVGLGSFLTLTGSNISIDTQPVGTADYVDFGSLTATVTVSSSLSFTGTGTNFGIDSNGNLVTKPGFGVSLSTTGVTGSSIKWPSWMPITVSALAVTWPNFTADPTNLQITVSAAVNASFASGKFAIGGNVTGATIDLGLLQQGKFPIISLQGAGLTVSGTIGGVTVSGGAFVAILREDASGKVIPTSDTTTPVAQRVFYGGITGTLAIAGLGGVSLWIGLSQYGPLDAFIDVNVPIPIGETGLVLNNLHGGINFNTLATPASAKDLATNPTYTPPTQQVLGDVNTPGTWEYALTSDVLAQLANGAGTGGTYNAFANPFTIDAGADIYDEDATANAFDLSGDIEVDTTGKLLVQGDIYLGGKSGVDLKAGAFLDLSQVASGKASLMVYAKAPAAAPILTIYGNLALTYTASTATLDLNISGEAIAAIPGLPGGLDVSGSADFKASSQTRSLDVTVQGSATLKPDRRARQPVRFVPLRHHALGDAGTVRGLARQREPAVVHPRLQLERDGFRRGQHDGQLADRHPAESVATVGSRAVGQPVHRQRQSRPQGHSVGHGQPLRPVHRWCRQRRGPIPRTRHRLRREALGRSR